MSVSISSPPTAQETFDQIEQELGAGMVPRLFLLLEGRPDVLAHVWGQFRAIVLTGQVPRVVKEMIGTVVATATHCEYVRTVHFHSLALQGVGSGALEAVRAGDYTSPALNHLTRAALGFASRAAGARAAHDNSGAEGTEPPWEVARAAALRDLESLNLDAAEQFELLATVALFEQICTIANLLALDPTQP